MKPIFQRSAFTLVELLTVIAIIAILMGLLFPVIGTVKDKARVVEATNTLKELVTAVTQYYGEYSKYPLTDPAGKAAGTDTYVGDDATATTMIKVLRGTPITDTNVKTLNPRFISYIDLPSAKNPVPAKAYSGLDSNGRMHDPWGGVYRFWLDTNYDGLIKNPYTIDTGAGSTDLTKGVIVWSLGKDGAGKTDNTTLAGNKGADPFKDDVLSW